MTTVLVTGAGGYIGTALIPMLLEAGYGVRAVDRFFFGRDLLADHDKLEVVQEDTRRLTLEHFSGIDAVIDLAALSNDPSGELFQDQTWEINWQARAKANEKAENDVLQLADEDFAVTVLRQATVYGYAPRMRFDLAINGMTYGAYTTGKLPLMRDGTQWRPMVHVRDTASAQIFMLETDRDAVNGQIFNVGSAENVYQIGPLGELVARIVPRDVAIDWYGDPDHRSYRVGFDRIEALGWKAQYQAEDGVAEICQHLADGSLEKGPNTITLNWYRELVHWHRVVRDVEMYGGILDI